MARHTRPGLLPARLGLVERTKLIDPFMPKVEDWVERSKGKIRADGAFENLEAMGFTGSDRTVRWAVTQGS